jgi:cyclopropane-fatty-acyl-phospholipid synthase
MNTRRLSVDAPDFLKNAAKPTALNRVARRIVLSRLEKLKDGHIVVSENGEHTTFGRLAENAPLTAKICVLNPKFYNSIVFGGAVGAGEAYINGYWECNELGSLLRMLIRNREVLEQVDSGLAVLGSPLRKMFHAFNRNTRNGSRKNVAVHYDLGNDFYQLWLDSKMMYSCAYFDTPDTTLDDAATENLDRICRKLDLSAGESVIEIGTGWGGFAIHAARHYGCHVTTTTISRQQYDHAQQTIRDAGL